jgi:hypothetical protein
VLVLLAISLIAAVLFVGGAAVGPVLSGDGGDGVFPIVDILTGDGGDDPPLALEANRTELSVGERVAFTVTDGNDTPVTNASVSVAGESHGVDGEGRVVVRVAEAGSVTATASVAADDDSRLESNDVDLAVEPRSVRLRVAANRSAATAGEPIALTLRRADSGRAVRGSLAATVLPDGDRILGDEIRRANGSRLVVVPERAGRLFVVGTREAGDAEVYESHTGTIRVQRRGVGLDLTVDPATVVAGEFATATVRRADTGERVAATLSVDGGTAETGADSRTVETGPDGEATIPFETAGTATIEATAAPTAAVRFVPNAAQVSVERRPVPLALDVEPTAITDGGRIDVAVTRADTGAPVEGTVEVAGRRVDTAANGTASLRIDAVGEQPVVATAPDTPAISFAPANATVSVADATFDLSIVDAPESVAPGASFSVTVRATNRGPAAGTDTLRFRVDGEHVESSPVTLDSGEEAELTFEAVAPDSSGELVVTVEGSDAKPERTTLVES